MTLRNYQQRAIDATLEKLNEGVNRQVLVLATGLGKAQPLSEPILTPNGWTTMGDLRMGDFIIGSDGDSHLVTGIFPQGEQDVYKITLSDGSITYCTLEHLWDVQTKSQKHRTGKFVTKTTKELLKDLKDGGGNSKWFLPLVKPVNFTPQPIGLDPYVLGVILGDGGITHRCIFSTADNEIVEKVQEKLPHEHTIRHLENYDFIIDPPDHGWNSNQVVEWLKELHLWGKGAKEKFIPISYLYNTTSIRLEVLRGLMDCDGYVRLGNGNAGEFNTSSPQLAKDVYELVQSLGGTPTFRIKEFPTYTHKEEKRIGATNYRIGVNLKSINPFSLSRKKEIYNMSAKQGQTRAIVRIEKVKRDECQCITVDAPDSLYVTRNYILTHNTVIFSDLIRQRIHETGKKALVLAHREELLTQAQDKIKTIAPTLTTAIEMADQKAEPDADVIIASVATIGRAGSKRIQKFNPKDFCLLVVDEAHHASAESYKNVFRYFGVLKQTSHADDIDLDSYQYKEKTTAWNTDCLLLGVTATPNRMDNEGIDKIFDDVVFNYGILDGIRDGWLSRIHAFRVDTTTSIDAVHTRAGDFAQDELADAINNPERNNLVVKTYTEQFKGKQALVFAIDVAHATALKNTFLEKGVKTQMVDGNTPKEMRRQILEDFHNKTLQVVVNCMVLTEGYDNDTIDAIFMARPTKSGILYQQMIGRGTRTHHEKPYLTIVDFVDNTYRHQLKTSASLLGIEGMINFRGNDIVDALGEIEKIRELAPDYNLNNLDFARLDYVMEEVDLMGGLTIPKVLEDKTTFAWHRYGDNAYRISLGDAQYIYITETLTNQWEAVFQYWDRETRKIQTEKLGEDSDLSTIVSRVDQYIRNNYEEAVKLVNMEARWRKDPITENQARELRRLGVDQNVINQLNKGQASQLQTKLYARAGKKQQVW